MPPCEHKMPQVHTVEVPALAAPRSSPTCERLRATPPRVAYGQVSCYTKTAEKHRSTINNGAATTILRPCRIAEVIYMRESHLSLSFPPPRPPYTKPNMIVPADPSKKMV